MYQRDETIAQAGACRQTAKSDPTVPVVTREKRSPGYTMFVGIFNRRGLAAHLLLAFMVVACLLSMSFMLSGDRSDDSAAMLRALR